MLIHYILKTRFFQKKNDFKFIINGNTEEDKIKNFYYYNFTFYRKSLFFISYKIKFNLHFIFYWNKFYKKKHIFFNASKPLENNNKNSLIIKKTLNNWFFTLVNSKGMVLRKYSIGLLKIKTKKKKKSIESFDLLSEFIIADLHKKNLFFIHKIIITNSFKFQIRFIKNFLKFIHIWENKHLIKGRIYIKKIEFWKNQTHNGLRKKKRKRI